MKIGICSDHAGFAYKSRLIGYLERKGYEVKDFGTHSEITGTWLETEFEGGRHQRRIDKIPVR